MLTSREWNHVEEMIDKRVKGLEKELQTLKQELSKPSRVVKQTISKKSTENA